MFFGTTELVKAGLAGMIFIEPTLNYNITTTKQCPIFKCVISISETDQETSNLWFLVGLTAAFTLPYSQYTISVVLS